MSISQTDVFLNDFELFFQSWKIFPHYIVSKTEWDILHFSFYVGAFITVAFIMVLMFNHAHNLVDHNESSQERLQGISHKETIV